MVRRRHAAVDRLLQYNLLDVVRRETTFRQSCADMQAKFIPLPERDQGADHQYAADAMVEMRAGPDIGPGMPRDQVDEFGVERIRVGGRFIDPGVAEHFSALGHAIVAALLIVHCWPPVSVASES